MFPSDETPGDCPISRRLYSTSAIPELTAISYPFSSALSSKIEFFMLNLSPANNRITAPDLEALLP